MVAHHLPVAERVLQGFAPSSRVIASQGHLTARLLTASDQTEPSKGAASNDPRTWRHTLIEPLRWTGNHVQVNAAPGASQPKGAAGRDVANDTDREENKYIQACMVVDGGKPGTYDDLQDMIVADPTRDYLGLLMNCQDAENMEECEVENDDWEDEELDTDE